MQLISFNSGILFQEGNKNKITDKHFLTHTQQQAFQQFRKKVTYYKQKTLAELKIISTFAPG